MNTMRKLINDAIENHPAPGNDPVSHLRHTVSLLASRGDDDHVVDGSHGVWDNGWTGLTMGDLRALLAMVDKD